MSLNDSLILKSARLLDSPVVYLDRHSQKNPGFPSFVVNVKLTIGHKVKYDRNNIQFTVEGHNFHIGWHCSTNFRSTVHTSILKPDHNSKTAGSTILRMGLIVTPVVWPIPEFLELTFHMGGSDIKCKADLRQSIDSIALPGIDYVMT